MAHVSPRPGIPVLQINVGKSHLVFSISVQTNILSMSSLSVDTSYDSCLLYGRSYNKDAYMLFVASDIRFPGAFHTFQPIQNIFTKIIYKQAMRYRKVINHKVVEFIDKRGIATYLHLSCGSKTTIDSIPCTLRPIVSMTNSNVASC